MDKYRVDLYIGGRIAYSFDGIYADSRKEAYLSIINTEDYKRIAKQAEYAELTVMWDATLD